MRSNSAFRRFRTDGVRRRSLRARCRSGARTPLQRSWLSMSFRRKAARSRCTRVRRASRNGGRLSDVMLDNGTAMRGEIFVFACGPWLGKVFPDVMGQRLRIPIGQVLLLSPRRPAINRFTFPNCPSWNVPGVTGWPALGVDNRGFRVRGGGGRPPQDPDTSVRWVDSRYHEGARNVLNAVVPRIWPSSRCSRRAHATTKAVRVATSSSTNTRLTTTCGLSARAMRNRSRWGRSPASTLPSVCWANPLIPNSTPSSRFRNETFELQPTDVMRARRMGIGDPEDPQF